MNVDIRRATPADREGMHQVLTAAGLSTLEVPDPCSYFWVACQGSVIVGTCGLEIDHRAGLVRSVAVDQALRAGGVGRSLLDACTQFARAQGLEQLYLFSKDTGSYFLQHGWEEVPVRTAAEALQAAAQVKRYETHGWYPNERAFSRRL